MQLETALQQLADLGGSSENPQEFSAALGNLRVKSPAAFHEVDRFLTNAMHGRSDDVTAGLNALHSLAQSYRPRTTAGALETLASNAEIAGAQAPDNGEWS